MTLTFLNSNRSQISNTSYKYDKAVKCPMIMLGRYELSKLI